MSSVRLRRLQSDYDAVRRLVRLHPRIDIDGVQGNPPQRYRFVLRVGSLRDRGGEITRAAEHRLEVTLPHGYPRDAPMFRMLTPVFHPNIAPHAVCIGDHWTASESLDQLVQRVGEMLAYQTYNIKSPLNGRAAQWVEENPEAVPTDRDEFFIDLSQAPIPSAEMRAVRCGNCGATESEFAACASEHVLCADCVMKCETCGNVQCLICGDTRCLQCNPHPPCASCGNRSAQLVSCDMGHQQCPDCRWFCNICGTLLCRTCGMNRCPRCHPV